MAVIQSGNKIELLDIIGSGAEGNIKLIQLVNILGKIKTNTDTMILLCNNEKNELIYI